MRLSRPDEGKELSGSVLVVSPTRQKHYNDWMNNGGSHENYARFWGKNASDEELTLCFKAYVKYCRERILPGRYRHFKSSSSGEAHYYNVHSVGPYTEKKEVLVCYTPEYGDEEGESMFRPAWIFLEVVDRDGYRGPRFTQV